MEIHKKLRVFSFMLKQEMVYREIQKGKKGAILPLLVKSLCGHGMENKSISCEQYLNRWTAEFLINLPFATLMYLSRTTQYSSILIHQSILTDL